jgi:hypothetical protein
MHTRTSTLRRKRNEAIAEPISIMAVIGVKRGLGHKGIIKPTGNGHVVVTRRPMYVKTVIVIHSIVKSQKVKTKFNYLLLLLTS